jgi:hypothetical protein
MQKNVKRKDSFDCSQALLWGLSERVFRQRWENAQRCLFDDREKVFTLPKKDRRDHPLFIKWETCIRNIMSGGLDANRGSRRNPEFLQMEFRLT